MSHRLHSFGNQLASCLPIVSRFFLFLFKQILNLAEHSLIVELLEPDIMRFAIINLWGLFAGSVSCTDGCRQGEGKWRRSLACI